MNSVNKTLLHFIQILKSLLISTLFLMHALQASAMGNTPPSNANVSGLLQSKMPSQGVKTTRYGDKTYDEYVWLGAHNAFASTGKNHGAWIVANQRKSYEEMLDAGVRVLSLDIRDFKSATWQCVLSIGFDCYPRDIYLCHGSCSGVPGINYALPRKTLTDALSRIGWWMRLHPDAVVTILLEDYVDDKKLFISALERSGTMNLLFNPYSDKRKGQWPKLSDMVLEGKRLLIFTDNNDNARKASSTGLDSQFFTQNYWSMGLTGSDVSCNPRWKNIPLTDKTRPFHMSHHRDVPSRHGAGVDNSEGKLRSRIMNQCYATAHRYPNIVSLDFVDIGDGKAVVDWLNKQVSP